MESPGVFHLEGNPELQETAGEASRCSRTPAHPEKQMEYELYFYFLSTLVLSEDF